MITTRGMGAGFGSTVATAGLGAGYGVAPPVNEGGTRAGLQWEIPPWPRREDDEVLILGRHISSRIFAR